MTVIAPASIPSYGEVFTRPWVAALLLDLVGYSTRDDLGDRRFLEPSCGSGAFLGPAVQRLIESANARRRDPATLHDAIRAYDLRPENVDEGARTVLKHPDHRGCLTDHSRQADQDLDQVR